MRINKLKLSVFLVILFHVCGAVGILFTEYRQWFIDATPVTLLLMAALIVFTQKELNKHFFIFFLLSFTAGMLVEGIGVNTGILFGDYSYSNILGPGIFNIPFLIGINWFVIMYCCGCVTFIFEEWVMKKMGITDEISGSMQTISFVVDAALLAVFFDWMLEPAAIKLGFWKWSDDAVPLFNYLCWFLISAGLMTIFRKCNFNKHNIFALHLLIIQMLFFLLIETF